MGDDRDAAAGEERRGSSSERHDSDTTAPALHDAPAATIPDPIMTPPRGSSSPLSSPRVTPEAAGDEAAGDEAATTPWETTEPSAAGPPQPPSRHGRKRTERRHGCENMFSLEQLFTRDLRITGVSKKGASWRYHIEILDVRASLTPFTNATPPSSSTSSSLPPVVRYSVERRYNDFRRLRQDLDAAFAPEVLESLPAFPDGGLLSYIRGDDPTLLRYRKEQLQRYLRALDANEDTKWSWPFIHFLRPDPNEFASGPPLSTTSTSSMISLPPTLATDDDSITASGVSLSGSEIGYARVNASAGYVSLSCVRSPEIRFKKLPSDGRGDWKRRKIERARRLEERRASTAKLLFSGAENGDERATDDSDSSSSDDGDDTDHEDQPNTGTTALMRLLSLDPTQAA